ncbi:hypothetical protein D3C86_1490970 [compost metagenome]
MAFANQPAENPPGVQGIRNPTLRSPAIPGRDIVFGDRPPERVRRVGGVHPAFDAREQPFDARSIPLDAVRLSIHGARRQDFADPVVVDAQQHRHQVFGTREHEDVGLLRRPILRQALFRFTRDNGKRQVPAETEGPVCCAGVVVDGQLGTESAAPGRRSNRHRHRARPGDGVRGKLLAHPAEGTAAFGRDDLGRQAAIGGAARAIGRVFSRLHRSLQSSG